MVLIGQSFALISAFGKGAKRPFYWGARWLHCRTIVCRFVNWYAGAEPSNQAQGSRARGRFRRAEVQPLERLFLEVVVGGFPVQCTAAYDASISERDHNARSATALANSPAAGPCQHVTTSRVVPAHKVGSDGVLSEQHRRWIVDMSGRNVSMRVHGLQSLNKSLFECVDQHMFEMIAGLLVGSLGKGLMTPPADGVGRDRLAGRKILALSCNRC
jgi:hypothetical protein